MSKIGLLVRIEAKPEYADQVEQLLRDAEQLVGQEPGTVSWFAFRQSATVFGVFDTFADEEGRTEHLQGKVAAALGEIAETSLVTGPEISKIDLLAIKNS